MARKPEVPSPKDVLNRADLVELQRKLSSMSVTGLQDFYRTAYYRCGLESEQVPDARAIQELVQAWKEMRKWK
jgi:hypothetical protein